MRRLVRGQIPTTPRGQTSWSQRSRLCQHRRCRRLQKTHIMRPILQRRHHRAQLIEGVPRTVLVEWATTKHLQYPEEHCITALL